MKLKKIMSMVVCVTLAMGLVTTTPTFAHVKQDGTPVNIQVPTLGCDDDSILLTWEKGENYQDIVDYNVYQDGEFIGTASENFAKNSSFTNEFIKSFYEKDKENFHVKIQILSYKVTGLSPDTEYEFTVRGVLANGQETEESDVVVQKTTKEEKVFNIVDFGAKDTGRIVDYVGHEEEIQANTKAIQAAIDACTDGGKVVIPSGTYTSGALWLKSNMTLELQEGAVLSGSTNADDYPDNYLLRDYSTDRRAWGLVNAYSKDGSLENIRIVGKGTIDGNGWKYGSAKGTFGTDPIYQAKDELDPAGDEYKLPLYTAGINTTVYNEENEEASLGLLAKDAVKKARENGFEVAAAYSMRPTLMILKGVDGLFVEDVTVKNPAFHGMSVGECENVVINSTKHLSYDDNNGDGIGIDSTKNCLVFSNFFDTGDDTINFASGLGALSKFNEPSENVRIFNNFVREGHGGIIAAGSHTGALIKDVLAEDNVSNLSDMPFRFKSNPVNGGGVNNVLIRDNAVANPTKQAFVFTTQYSDENQILQFEPAKSVAEFYDITVENVTVSNTEAKGSAVPVLVDGKITDNHRNINFSDVTFKNFVNGSTIRGLSNSEFNNVLFTATAPDHEKQWIIEDSNDVTFTGYTGGTLITYDASSRPVWNDGSSIEAVPAAQSVDLSWNEASDNIGVKQYVVTSYLGDKKLQETKVASTSHKEEGLMPGLEYTFKVEAEDATGNRTTTGPSINVTTTEDAAITGIKQPSSKTVTVLGTPGYTWTNIQFNACDDESVRAYEIYVNGEKVSEVVNPSRRGVIKDGVIQTNVSGLKEGFKNNVRVKAVNDRGDVYEYKSAKPVTWEAFDREAPTWKENAKLRAKVQGNTVTLNWDKAKDDSGILGYRVYVNGKPVGDNFTPANREITTDKTSFTLENLEPGTYTFKVEAGDTWWRAESTLATIGAPTNWTGFGPSTTIEVK